MAAVVISPEEWTATNTPALATVASVSRVALPTVRHCCRSIAASAAGAAAASGICYLVLRDGPTATGTILWQVGLQGAINDNNLIAISGLNIWGTAGNAMTLEFTGAGATGSQQTVAMTGYDSTSIG